MAIEVLVPGAADPILVEIGGFIPPEVVTEHSALSGLAVGDDHPQYALANGSRGAFAPASGIALNAIYGTAVATGDSRLFNERTPTSVGLANKLFYQSPATTNDSFAIPVSENSVVVKRLTFLALWDWITGKLGALTSLTAGGAWSFSGQIASSGSTDATNTNNVVNVATNDAMYGREYIQIISTAVNAYSTAFVNGPDLVIPAGNYDFELFGLLEIVGETSGGDINFRCSPATDVTTAVETRLPNLNALGTSGTAATSFRKGTVLNLADHLGTIYAIAPNNYGTVQTRGTTVLASETTVSFRVKQRVTDAVNPATLAVGSFIKFTKR